NARSTDPAASRARDNEADRAAESSVEPGLQIGRARRRAAGNTGRRDRIHEQMGCAICWRDREIATIAYCRGCSVRPIGNVTHHRRASANDIAGSSSRRGYRWIAVAVEREELTRAGGCRGHQADVLAWEPEHRAARDVVDLVPGLAVLRDDIGERLVEVARGNAAVFGELRRA